MGLGSSKTQGSQKILNNINEICVAFKSRKTKTTLLNLIYKNSNHWKIVADVEYVAVVHFEISFAHNNIAVEMDVAVAEFVIGKPAIVLGCKVLMWQVKC